MDKLGFFIQRFVFQQCVSEELDGKGKSKMSAFGPTRPVYLRTYGKHKRKVEQWFSPNLRKNVFSSTSLSDQSILETTYSKKR